MKFRIVEFEEKNKEGHNYFVEIGTPYEEPFLKFFTREKTKWSKNVDEDMKTIGHASFDEALEMICSLRKQLPIYHNIA